MESHWISRTVAAVTATGLTLLLATGAVAEQAQDADPEPTVVLVHGGFNEASVWDAEISHLQDDGYPVIPPANPLRGTLADSAYLASVLNTLSGPLILVGASEDSSTRPLHSVDNAQVASHRRGRATGS